MLVTFRQANALDMGRLLLVSAIWGSSFVFIDLALRSFGPITVAALRITMASLVLLAIAYSRESLIKLGRKEWLIIFVVGLLNSALPFFLISWAQQHINAAEAAVLMATGAFSSLILSHFTTSDERINGARALGLLVGFIGVLVLFWDDLQGNDVVTISALAAVTGAGMCYATSGVLARRISEVPAVTMATYTVTSAMLYMLPLALFLETPKFADATLISWSSATYLGVIATAFAYIMRFTIIRTNGAVFASQAGYLVPVFGTFWGWLLLSNQIRPELGISLVIILCGVFITRKGVK
ncbi:MAG: drug/metabolite transporter (DMT)-like permease [Saprospiraceae bacterium]|jgi:drug/metabolite transporter (DMT)-like permease